jgi:hypothetical protein|tara:strand:- start:954 stop:1145 length:192 start_codon:yes stop_codon:yes gene_type:complete
MSKIAVYVVKDYEDAPNMYVLGVFSTIAKADEYITKLEERDNNTYFNMKIAEYIIDYEDMEEY